MLIFKPSCHHDISVDAAVFCNVDLDFYHLKKNIPPKTNMDTQNNGLEKVIPFKYGHFGYLC